MAQPKINYEGPTPDELDKMAGASYIASVLPYLKEELTRMESAVKTRIFTAINDGSFTAEMADAAWREIHAHHRLLKRLETRIRSGQTVGERNADFMEIGGPHG